MIIDCHININSEWQYLPWKQINGRLILIQKKILEASKQYDLKLLNNTQNILLNSSEVRIFAIHKIVNNINEYYKKYNNESYLFNDIDKYYLFKYLFNHNSLLKTKLKFLAEKIKEYLIYLCIGPEWKVRLKPFKYAENKINTFLNNNRQTLNWDKMINNIRWSPYICNHILYWIKNKFFVQCDIFKYLPNLLLKICELNKVWNKIKAIKFKCLGCFLKNKYIKQNRKILYMLLLQNKANKYYYDSVNILNHIKSKFYKKNSLNRLRFNRRLSWFNIVNITSIVLHSKLCDYIYLLNYSFINTIIKKINFLLSYLKIRKNYHFVIFSAHYYKLDLYNILYKKITLNFLYQYLFKIDR
uniref:Reverse transcriptase N-terminal domain-containing protein n=1 Tax=Ceramothamnion japonicum TaxID=218448 RepID=A0A1C9CD94_CERJP|nr:hypothetical protein Ceram_056 [Ceramium japonicum]AOM66332.1 hypothetical protein Ceram_056 [Ceramium japonicum]